MKGIVLQIYLHWTEQGSSDATTGLNEDEAQSPSEGGGRGRKDLGRWTL
jgi:hypothetical protein